MKKIILFHIFFAAFQAFSSVYLKVLYVADHKTDCGTTKCLLTRDTPTDTFSVFNHTIGGFNYEEGYEYCLLVEVQQSDSQQLKYILSELKSKTKTILNTATALKKQFLSIPDSSKWMLYKLRMKDGSTRTFSLQKAYLQFDTKNNTVSGNTDCNALSAGFTIDSSSFKFDNIVTTKMACGKHAIEQEFLNMMNSATNYKVTSKLFYLLKGKTLLGLFTLRK